MSLKIVKFYFTVSADYIFTENNKKVFNQDSDYVRFFGEVITKDKKLRFNSPAFSFSKNYSSEKAISFITKCIEFCEKYPDQMEDIDKLCSKHIMVWPQ